MRRMAGVMHQIYMRQSDFYWTCISQSVEVMIQLMVHVNQTIRLEYVYLSSDHTEKTVL